MAGNVFGNPVTDETVKLVYPSKVNIEAKDRAEVALLYKNAEEKDKNVSTYVHNLKSSYGTGTSTLCMVYNASGGNLTYITYKDWGGSVWKTPYPQIIQNGQWGGWLHARGSLMGPSKGAVVYRGKNNDGVVRDYCLAWNTPRRDFQNRVKTEVREQGHYSGSDSNDRWSDINALMEKNTLNSQDRWGGCLSIISIGNGSSPEMVATMSLDGIDLKYQTIAEAVPESLDSKYQDVVEGDEGPAEK